MHFMQTVSLLEEQAEDEYSPPVQLLQIWQGLLLTAPGILENFPAKRAHMFRGLLFLGIKYITPSSFCSVLSQVIKDGTLCF